MLSLAGHSLIPLVCTFCQRSAMCDAGRGSTNVGIIDEARQINSSLRRVGQQARVSVTMADSAASTLDQDGSTIEKALNEHKYELKGALNSTSRRLAKIKNAAANERLYMTAAIGFFLAVVVYITSKRMGLLGTLWYIVQCKGLFIF